MKKKVVSALLVIILVFGLSACGSQQADWQAQYDLGVRYLSEGNYEEAVLAFEAAIEIDAKQTPAYVGLADAYIGLGDTEQAVAALNEGLLAIPDDAGLQSKLSEIEMSSPETTSDYAKIYYQYTQDVLIPNGDDDGCQFVDADMVDIENDGTPELIVSMTNCLRYFNYLDGAIQLLMNQSYAETYDNDVETMGVFINDYNGEKRFFEYWEGAYESERYVSISIRERDGDRLDSGGTPSLEIHAQGSGVAVTDDGVYLDGTSTIMDVTESDYILIPFDQAVTMIEEYLHPSSTFCHVPFGEPPAFAENTHGKRLKEYSE